ncbi:TPA: Bug family tripartite tricarboxylate transporter substrate binding protein [Pseudomonas aeruginosa]
MTQLLRRIAALSLISLAATQPAQSQGYPTQPIHLVIPYAPGGAGDTAARVLAEQMSARLGQRIVPENKPGAATVLAAGQVARAAPDGYTLLISTLAHALNPSLQPNLPYDPLKDFEFIGKVGSFGFVLVTSPKLKINDFQGLVERMRTQPGKLQFGSAGVGSPMHLGGEYLKHLTQTDAIHVPYKGESAALTDLLGGHISFMLCTVSTCTARVKDGSLQALVAPSPTRSALLPAVPTSAQAGLPGYEIYTWIFLAAPKGTPAAVVQRLNKALNEALADERFRARVTAMGVDLDTSSSPADTRRFVQAEIEKWQPLIKASGMTLN